MCWKQRYTVGFDKNEQSIGVYCKTNYTLLQAFPLFNQLEWQLSVNKWFTRPCLSFWDLPPHDTQNPEVRPRDPCGGVMHRRNEMCGRQQRGVENKLVSSKGQWMGTNLSWKCTTRLEANAVLFKIHKCLLGFCISQVSQLLLTRHNKPQVFIQGLFSSFWRTTVKETFCRKKQFLWTAEYEGTRKRTYGHQSCFHRAPVGKEEKTSLLLTTPELSAHASFPVWVILLSKWLNLPWYLCSRDNETKGTLKLGLCWNQTWTSVLMAHVFFHSSCVFPLLLSGWVAGVCLSIARKVKLTAFF